MRHQSGLTRLPSFRSSSLFLVAALAASACGSSDSPAGAGTSHDGGTVHGDAGGVVIPTPSKDAGGGPIITPGAGGDAGTTTSNGCSAASQLVYVFTSNNEIYSFQPQQKVFTKISTLNCSALGMTANSMAVDREGNAWVNYNSAIGINGSIFKVNIATGSCAATNITLPSGWYQVGMGFASASPTDPTDTLYVADTATAGCGIGGGGGKANAGLGWIDTTAGTLHPLGPFSGDLNGLSAELTGTGDGRLFGFFVGTPVKVAQLDKSSGAISNELSMAGVACPQAWAFSFWGGDFYMYTSDGTKHSTVSHYDNTLNKLDTSYIADTGMVIVGAGVSTCAPVTQPTPQ